MRLLGFVFALASMTLCSVRSFGAVVAVALDRAAAFLLEAVPRQPGFAFAGMGVGSAGISSTPAGASLSHSMRHEAGVPHRSSARNI